MGAALERLRSEEPALYNALPAFIDAHLSLSFLLSFLVRNL